MSRLGIICGVLHLLSSACTDPSPASCPPAPDARLSDSQIRDSSRSDLFSPPEALEIPQGDPTYVLHWALAHDTQSYHVVWAGSDEKFNTYLFHARIKEGMVDTPLGLKVLLPSAEKINIKLRCSGVDDCAVWLHSIKGYNDTFSVLHLKDEGTQWQEIPIASPAKNRLNEFDVLVHEQTYYFAYLVTPDGLTSYVRVSTFDAALQAPALPSWVISTFLSKDSQRWPTLCDANDHVALLFLEGAEVVVAPLLDPSTMFPFLAEGEQKDEAKKALVCQGNGMGDLLVSWPNTNKNERRVYRQPRGDQVPPVHLETMTPASNIVESMDNSFLHLENSLVMAWQSDRRGPYPQILLRRFDFTTQSAGEPQTISSTLHSASAPQLCRQKTPTGQGAGYGLLYGSEVDGRARLFFQTFTE